MNNNVFSFIVIPILVLAFMAIGRFIRKKFARPEVESNVQTPGKFDRIIKTFLMVIAVLTGLMMVAGFIAQEFEMAMVFLVMTVIFVGSIVILNHAYDMSYQ